MKLYHGTTEAVLPSIEESGLWPSRWRGGGPFYPTLTNDIEIAQRRAQQRWRDMRNVGVEAEPVVLVYEIPAKSPFVRMDEERNLYVAVSPILKEYLVDVLYVPHIELENYPYEAWRTPVELTRPFHPVRVRRSWRKLWRRLN